MVYFEPPSFSLGLDFTLDSEPQTTVTGNPSSEPAPQSPISATLHSIQDFDDDDFESPTLFPAPDRQSFNPPRPLKRLRRDLTTDPGLVRQKREAVNLVLKCKEIEELSSQKDSCIADKPPLKEYPSECSISKFPLPGHGIFIEQSTSNIKQQVSNALASANFKTSSSSRACPNPTVSPFRRFRLIDSDSDDPFLGEGTTNISSSEQEKKEASRRIAMREDLWDDFCLKERFNIPTPAFDEVCEECFRSVQNKVQSTNCEQQLIYGYQLRPSHRYYFHVDSRIQNLVHSRLPNFVPLGAVNNMQPSTLDINYMSQFSFSLKERFNIPTSMFDEVCEEYFKSMQNKVQNTNCEQQLIPGYQLPPHRYYFHVDSRIQNLVHSRLPNFLPLGAVNNMQPCTSDINYT